SPDLPSARRRALLRRLELVEALRASGVRPEWMVLIRLPVVPPALRPIVTLASGKKASHELNRLYAGVLQRNARLRAAPGPRAPPAPCAPAGPLPPRPPPPPRPQTRRADRPVLGSGGRPLRSLSDLLGGKEGRFRANLLGKRVDYSARAVIVVGPELQLR